MLTKRIMPSISSHLYLAIQILREKPSLAPWPYLLGAIAPDSVDQKENGHFFNGTGFDHEGFLSQYLPPCTGRGEESFVRGYHLHLWYDEYVRRQGFISHKNPDSLDEGKLKRALWAEVMALDGPEVLSFDKTLEKSSREIDIAKFKFDVNPVKRYERCIEQCSSAPEGAVKHISEKEYRNYINMVKLEFLASW